MAESLTTIDHETIRRWATDRDGVPATVAGTPGGDDEAGILRFDFPGGAGEDELTHVEWDEWFDKFEKENLALVYQDEKVSGEPSTFFRLIKR